MTDFMEKEATFSFSIYLLNDLEFSPYLLSKCERGWSKIDTTNIL